MVQALEKTTPEDYLALEVESPERHEYINGEIRLVTGGTPNHNRISGNLLAELKFLLKQKPYEVFVTDQRLWIPAANIYTYPDVMVMKEPIETVPNRTDTLVNPLFIAEVLSQSTQSYDRVEKFAAYRTIECFQEYLLIDQYSCHVEHYIKTEPRTWLFIEYNGADTMIEIQSFACQVSIADVYSKVQFTTSDE